MTIKELKRELQSRKDALENMKLEDLKRDEIIRLKQEKEMQERYKYNLRQHKYFTYFGER